MTSVIFYFLIILVDKSHNMMDLEESTKTKVSSRMGESSIWSNITQKSNFQEDLYRLSVFVLVANRANQAFKDFQFTSEAREFNSYDDLIIVHDDSITFIKSKYCPIETRNLNKVDFLNEQNLINSFLNLTRYFDSWLLLLSREAFIQGKKTRLIIYTNIILNDQDEYLEECFNKTDQFLFEGLDGKYEAITTRFKYGKTRLEFINFILKTSKILKQKQIQNATEKINQFLDELILKLGHYDISDISQIIKKELIIEWDTLHQLYDCIYGFIVKWHIGRENCVLKFGRTNELSLIKKTDLQRVYLLDKTRYFEDEFNHISLGSMNVKELVKFLINKAKLLALVSGDGCRPFAYQSIIKYKATEKVKLEEWTFLETTSPYVKQLPDVIKLNPIKFLIFDCLKYLNELEFVIDSVINAAISNNKKLVLLLSEEKAKYFKEKLIFKEKFPIMQKIVTQDLELNQIKIMSADHKDKYLSVLGKQYKLSEIIKDKNSGLTGCMKNLDSILDILNSLEIAKRDKFSSQVYVANDLEEAIPCYDFLTLVKQAKAEIFIINGVDSSLLRFKFNNWFNKGMEYYFVEGSDSSKNNISKYRLVTESDLLTGRKFKEKLFYIEEENGSLPDDEMKNYKNFIKLLIKSDEKVIIEERTDGVKLPILSGFEMTKNENSEGIIKNILTTHHFSILSANAGFGKSSFCEHLYQVWLQEPPSPLLPTWVMKINLSDFHFDSANSSIMSPIGKNLKLPVWQLRALKIDMTRKNKVVLLLDGLDEIKDEKQLQGLNNWISNLPLENISILLTTRPYAAHNIVLPSSSKYEKIHFITLKEYTPSQHKKYLTNFVKSVFNDSDVKIEAQLVKLAEAMYQSMAKTHNTSSSIISIPLKSFLFCEILKPLILSQKTKTRAELDIDYILDGADDLNTVKLFQRFIEIKLKDFLQKHMNLQIGKSSNFAHQTYTFSAAYNDIFMVYAFRQTFKLEYSFIHEILSKISYYTPEMISHELSDSGLVWVEKIEKEYYLKFYHKTYQEYFTALFFIRVILFDLISEEFKTKILEKRYDPQYRTVMSMAAGIVTSGTPLLPNLDTHIQKMNFWKAFCENGDILGMASTSLMSDCLREFTYDQKMELKEAIGNHEWSHLLLFIINKNITFSDIDESKDGNVPFLTNNWFPPGTLKKRVKLKFDEKRQLMEKLKDKRTVVDTTKSLLKEMEPSTVAQLFEEVIDFYGDDVFWAIDGGFESISLLGSSFNGRHSDYFVDTIRRDPEWSAIPAFQSIASFYSETRQLTFDNESAQEAYLNVLNCLINIKSNENTVTETEIKRLLKLSPTVILKSFEKYLNKKLNYDSKASSKNLVEQLNLFLNLLWCARILKFAVLIKKNNTLRFVKDISLDIEIGESNLGICFGKKFSEIGNVILESEKLEHLQFYPQSLIKLIPRNVFKVLDNEVFDFKEQFNLLKDNADLLLYYYKQVSKSRGLTKFMVDKFTEEVKSEKAINKTNSWSINGGIEIVAYTGVYFNQTLANYLFLRATYWPNDNEKTIKTLNIIRLFLQQAFENSGRNFDGLIFNYNGVLQKLYNYYHNDLFRHNPNAASYNTTLPSIIERNIQV
jgi:hypothetical protein